MPMPQGKRLRKREIVFAIAMGALAAGGAAIVLEESNDGEGPAPVAAEAEERTYQLTGFERISTTGPQDVEITYGEAYSVQAEGAVDSLEVAVENGELVIRPRNGIGWDWPGLNGTTLQVTVPRLTRVFLNGTGDISVDGVKGAHFVGIIEGFGGNIEIDGLEVDEAEFTIDGPGEIVAAGTARATRVTVNGPGEVQAGELRSQRAVVAVRGPGDVELAVQQEADVSVEGPGEVDIDGPARCAISTSGPGSVSCGEQSD